MIKGYLKLVVLKELMQESLTGYEIMQRLKSNTGKKPSSGTIYPLLADLHEKGFISQKDSEKKKFYRITIKGKKLVEKLISEREDMMVKRAALLDSVRAMLSEREKKELKMLERKYASKGERVEFLMLNHIIPLKGSIMNAISSGKEGIQKEVMGIIDDAKYKIDKLTSEGGNR